MIQYCIEQLGTDDFYYLYVWDYFNQDYQYITASYDLDILHKHCLINPEHPEHKRAIKLSSYFLR